MSIHNHRVQFVECLPMTYSVDSLTCWPLTLSYSPQWMTCETCFWVSSEKMVFSWVWYPWRLHWAAVQGALPSHHRCPHRYTLAPGSRRTTCVGGNLGGRKIWASCGMEWQEESCRHREGSPLGLMWWHGNRHDIMIQYFDCHLLELKSWHHVLSFLDAIFSSGRHLIWQHLGWRGPTVIHRTPFWKVQTPQTSITFTTTL